MTDERPRIADLIGAFGPLPAGVSSVDIVRALRDRDNDFLDWVAEHQDGRAGQPRHKDQT